MWHCWSEGRLPSAPWLWELQALCTLLCAGVLPCSAPPDRTWTYPAPLAGQTGVSEGFILLILYFIKHRVYLD